MQHTHPEIKAAFQELAAKWPSAIVSRDQIKAFTGGAISIGRMANLDSLGQGPERLRMGRKVVYPVTSLVEWLAARAEIIERKVS